MRRCRPHLSSLSFLLNRKLRLVELASRSVYTRGDGQCSNRRHRSSRHWLGRDSLGHSSRRIRGRALQTHVGEIRLGEILHRGSHRSRNLHESRHRGSRLRLNQRLGNQRCYGSHRASVSTATTSMTITTTSECRGWLSQADAASANKAIVAFRIMLPSLDEVASKDRTLSRRDLFGGRRTLAVN